MSGQDTIQSSFLVFMSVKWTRSGCLTEVVAKLSSLAMVVKIRSVTSVSITIANYKHCYSGGTSTNSQEFKNGTSPGNRKKS